MNRISNSLIGPQEFQILNLEPILSQFFNADAQNLFKSNRTNSLIVQWNRQVNNCLYEGKKAYALGEFLMKFKIKSYADLFVSNYVREISQVKYYGHSTTDDKLSEAALVLVGMINDLASKNLIRAVLTPLVAMGLSDGKVVVLSYFAVDQPNEALVQSMYGALQFNEGGIPPEFK